MLGKLVKIQRTKKGYTQKELADRIGVTHAAISKLEKHDVASKQIMIAIAGVLDSDFDLDWLEEHLRKYSQRAKHETAEILDLTIRRIVREEIDRDKNIMVKMYLEKEVNTKILRHEEKKKDS